MTEVLTREKKAAWTAWRSAYKSGTGRKILRQTGRILLGAAPGFALAFSDICGVSIKYRPARTNHNVKRKRFSHAIRT